MTSSSPIDEFLGNKPGSKWRARIQWLLAIAAAGVLIVLIGRFVNGGEVTKYATATLERRDLPTMVVGTGALQAVGEHAVVAGMPGTVAEVLVKDGDRVVTGQLLLKLDPSAIAEDISRTEALIAAREKALGDAVAQERAGRDRLGRFERVRRESGGTVPSDREMTEARDDLRQAGQRLRDTQTELAAARASLGERQTQQAATEIRARADGLVLRRLVQPGQAVTHDQTLIQVTAPITRLRMDIMVERGAIQGLTNGAVAEVTVPGVKSGVEARVEQVRTSRTADAGRAIVQLDVRNPDQSLRPGMTGTAKVGLATLKDALVVPEKALRFAQASDARAAGQAEGEAIYVLGEQGAPRRVPVTIAGVDGRVVAVSAPSLAPGAPVITGIR